MEQPRKTPKFLFVTKIRENKVRAYKLVKALSNGKYLYENIDNGFKECFLYTDIVANIKSQQQGYSNTPYKAQDRNEKVRKKRREMNANEH